MRTLRLVEAFAQTKTIPEWAKDRRCVVSLDVLKARVHSQHIPLEIGYAFKSKAAEEVARSNRVALTISSSPR